jgi:hypothetical protein
VASPGQVGGLDVELLVGVGVGRGVGSAPVREAVGADRGGLVDRQRVGLGPGQHRPEGPVHVHARHRQQPDIVADRGQGGLGVGGRVGAVVDHRLGVEVVDRPPQVGQVLAVGVEMVDLTHRGTPSGLPGPLRRQVGRLVLAPVHDQQLVPVGVELLDHGGPDEPGPAQHHHPHARLLGRSGPASGSLPAGAVSAVTARS